MGFSAWASYDCCGHPSDSRETSKPENGASLPDDVCAFTCCQATMIVFPVPSLEARFGPLWILEVSEKSPASCVGSYIYRPPIA